jgi:hypothetical protein
VEIIKDAYKEYLKLTNNPEVASRLVVAETINCMADKLTTSEFSHTLCMGIRKGLFGSDALDSSTIK